MKTLIDKLALFIISLALYTPEANNIYMIVPILFAIILSASLSYLDDDRITVAVFFAYIITCIINPSFVYFIPLICYDAIYLKFKGIWAFSFLPVFIYAAKTNFSENYLIATIIIVSYILKYRTVTYQNLEENYHKLRDNTKEISMKLEKQNKELINKQDYEINLATLRERNRIARDIHDNVGHLLSRCILQIGALLAVNKNEDTKESLRLVKGTLSEAMDSIRASVHNLHEEAIDLQTEINKLIDGFTYCAVKFEYDVETNLAKDLKYCFISVIKEALSNIIKHSNATFVSVIIREHPALYQLVVQDNGSSCGYNSENGIGIKNITERVAAIGGNVNISTGNGFRIFISIPKN